MLVLSRGVYDDVLAHARAAAPEECCGILLGARDGEVSRVMRAVRATNAADEPETTYEIPPREVVAASDEDGDEIVGFYHSHPAGPPALSDTDRREATWTDYHYLLVSLGDSVPVLDGWRWTGEAFDTETVVVHDGDSDFHR